MGSACINLYCWWTIFLITWLLVIWPWTALTDFQHLRVTSLYCFFVCQSLSLFLNPFLLSLLIFIIAHNSSLLFLFLMIISVFSCLSLLFSVALLCLQERRWPWLANSHPPFSWLSSLGELSLDDGASIPALGIEVTLSLHTPTHTSVILRWVDKE